MSNSMLIRCAIPVIVLLISKNFPHVAIFNCFLQFILFIITANIPALVTGRMSYVDLAWPFGLGMCHNGPENLKKSRPKKNLVKSNKSISRKNFWPNSIFCNFKNGQKPIFELGKSLKLPKMQFHEKIF